MPSDPRLDNILRALLQPYTPSSTLASHSRLFASCSAILTTLTNPLNVTLLTTQILTAPAVWTSPDPLHASLRVFGTFQSATLGKMELEVRGEAGAMGVQEWITAVVKGANRNVPRWKHILLLGGVLSAIRDGRDGQGGKGKSGTGGVAGGVGGGGNAYLIPRVTRRSLEDAFCRAVNLSVESGSTAATAPGGGNSKPGKDLESDVLSLILSHSINHLSPRAKMLIDYDALLLVVIRSIFYSSEGFQSGYFLSKIENDVVMRDGLLSWPAKSNSLLELQYRLSRPLFTSMSSVARLASMCVRESKSPGSIHILLDRMNEFTQTLTAQWNMTRLSGVSLVDEPRLLDPESRRATMPVVWQILKMVLFTAVLVVSEVSARLVKEEEWNEGRKVVASKILYMLRGLYFITSRLGTQGFTTYNFVYMSSIDILGMHKEEAERWVRSLAPQNVGTIPSLLLLRTYDLFFLNTVEHLIPILPSPLIHDLLIPICAPYLSASHDPNLHSQFESAHSVMLAIIAAAPAPPSSTSSSTSATPITTVVPATEVLPLYAGMIFSSFPGGLSRRQFRLAFSTLVKVCEIPPGENRLQGRGEVVMNIGYQRAKVAPETPLIEAAGDGGVTPAAAAVAAAAAPATVTAIAASPPNNSSTSPSPPRTAGSATPSPSPPAPRAPYTEKEIYILALIDSLPFLLPETLSRWLTPVAELVAKDVKDVAGKGRLRRRFWEVLTDGELDVERAEVGVRWWSEGGRELVEGYDRDGREDGGSEEEEGGKEEGEKEGGKEEMTKMLMDGENRKMEKKEHAQATAPAGATARAAAPAPAGGRQGVLAKL
ncbi:hypothetical protein L211DRAFT_854086 [Terfezia boudieri ATCC MYA-4762]|uniref:Uncharacterized protein n=1 Tax=Terfezia boudieri ATCC MYA-4762 TaxID=1051890 RepID=A0A3N4L7C5_9PEZI|nr:hypothetical protein L211DRAFT_854086 [Terfezia boudieri ATCC MYA-4762]